MSTRNNPETSNEAYRSLDLQQLNETYKQILFALSELGEGTFEEIAAKLKIDKSRVWKRMSELERMEMVYRPGNKRILKSGRNGFTWCLTSKTVPKTEKEEIAYKKGVKTAAEFATGIIGINCKNPVANNPDPEVWY